MSVPRRFPPPLAGLGTYADAAKIGYGVDANVTRLLRFQWTARRLMATMVAHLPGTPTWETKCALALHQWLLAEQVDALRGRVGEMRRPVPALDQSPDAALDNWLDEVQHARDEAELLTGMYGVALPALAAAYREHLTTTNLLVDHPTRRLLRHALLDLDDAVAWGGAALAALEDTDEAGRPDRSAWRDHLSAFLEAAGGVAGDGAPVETPLPPPRSAHPFRPDLHPRRDARFRGRYNFEFPPHEVYNHPAVPADERNLALLCKRTLEMDVPEMMASVMVERTDLPWAFHRDFSRQLWDEARHAMMGTVALTARGVDWTRLPLNVGFALRLNLHASALERQTLLFGIEQSLMPGDTGKRFEYETAVAAGDALSAHVHDYDWADEVLHAQIGRRWLRHEGIGPDEAVRRAGEIHERTWEHLEAYRALDPQTDWWDGFVREVLGRPSAPRPPVAGAPKILAE